MSVTTLKAVVVAQLQTMTGINRVFSSKREAANLGNFPAAIVSLSEDGGSIVTDNRGVSEHRYSIDIMLLVGSLAVTPLNELEERIEVWPDRIRAVLTPDTVKLTGSAVMVNDLNDSLSIEYTIGEQQIGDGNDYYGLSATLPIVERTIWN